MKINAVEMNDMVTKTYEPGLEMVRAMNLLQELANEKEFNEDSRYVEAKNVLNKCLIQYQTMSFNRGMDLCRANAIINTLNEGTVGRQLVKKARMKLED